MYNVDGGRTGFDDVQTKLATYNHLAFTELCVVFRPVDAQTLGYLLIERPQSQTLHSLIHDGQYRSTSMGRNHWLSALPGAKMQPGCNREGFNPRGHSGVRIGILGNNEGDCTTSDTGFGVGLDATGCYVPEDRFLLSAGSYDNPPCSASGVVVYPAFAYIFAH